MTSAIIHQALIPQVLFQSPKHLRDLVVLLAVENSEDAEEQVDDVKVKADRGSNLFLNMVVSHNELCIYQDVS